MILCKCSELGNIFVQGSSCVVVIIILKKFYDVLISFLNPVLIEINNQEIQWKKKDDLVIYLELHLDEKVTSKIHINKKLNHGYTRREILYLYAIITQPFK